MCMDYCLFSDHSGFHCLSCGHSTMHDGVCGHTHPHAAHAAARKLSASAWMPFSWRCSCRSLFDASWPHISVLRFLSAECLANGSCGAYGNCLPRFSCIQSRFNYTMFRRRCRTLSHNDKEQNSHSLCKRTKCILCTRKRFWIFKTIPIKIGPDYDKLHERLSMALATLQRHYIHIPFLRSWIACVAAGSVVYSCTKLHCVKCD